MTTMVIARFESVPMARSAAHALVADGFSEEVVSMFYGKRSPKGSGLWSRLAGALWRRRKSNSEILLVMQLSANHVQAAMSLLRDAGSVSVEQSQNDWQTGPRERPAATRKSVVVPSHGPAHRTQWQP